MTFKLGLTGSIGMGKSTTAKLFQDEGCSLWDADAAVHRLYSQGGAAVKEMAELLPEAVVDGSISRERLRSILQHSPDTLKDIEKIVHPLVAKDRREFLATTSSDICVLDIPLLFETGGEKQMDAVACVTVDPETQRRRVMERGTMSLSQFQTILSNQLPDEEKRKRSDYIIVTDTLEHAKTQVQSVVEQIRSTLIDA